MREIRPNSFFNSKNFNNNYTSAFKEKINKFSNEKETKDNYLSFENLDNIEKKITNFIDKNNQNPVLKSNKKNAKEKVTINSFYNISNLNNFNDKSLFNSLDKIKSVGDKILITQKEENVNKNSNKKSNPTKNKIEIKNNSNKKHNFNLNLDKIINKNPQIVDCDSNKNYEGNNYSNEDSIYDYSDDSELNSRKGKNKNLNSNEKKFTNKNYKMEKSENNSNENEIIFYEKNILNQKSNKKKKRKYKNKYHKVE